jgi:hypothetical protein
VEFSEFGFDDLRDCRDIKVIVSGMVGDIPRGNEDSAEDFRLEFWVLACLAEPYSSTP